MKTKYGTYSLHYTNLDGIRRRLSVGPDEGFAYRRANQFEGWILEGKDPERELQRIKQEEKAKQITLKEFFPEYMQRHSPHLSERTKEQYRFRFKMISQCQEILDCPLVHITKRMVLDYMNDRIARGVSNATANREATFIKGVLSRAVEWDVLKYNPLSRLKLLPEAPKREVNLSTEQAKELLQALPTGVDLIVEFALLTGIRKENILSLKIDQLKLNNSESEGLGPVGEVELLAKGNKRLRLPLSQQAVDVLRRAIGARLEGSVFLNPRSCDRYYDICDTFSKAVEKVGLKVNGGRFVFHDLRHAFATHLHSKGVSLDIIRQLLGHNDLATTDQYTTYNIARTSKALEKLPKIR